jgi:predicted SprT family Zn-dependent metalloprotease
MSYVIRERGIDRSHFPRKEEFVQRICEVMEMARNKYPQFNMANCEVPFVFIKTGQHAGMMQWIKLSSTRDVYNLLFNTVAIKQDWDHVYNDTIPHEIAHLVDHVLHGTTSHGSKWKRIALSLGCDGKRCHNIDMSEAKRKTRKAVYVATCGTEIKLTINMHNKVQNGEMRRLTSTRGIIRATEFTGKVVNA